MQQREPYTEQAEVRIAELDENGQGIAVVKRQKVAIKNALPGETVRIKARKRKAGMIIETMERLNESDVRCKVNCAIFERCGSCHLLHMEYQKQLEWKKQGVIKLLREAGLKGITVHDPVGMKEPYAYRNKVIIGFRKIVHVRRLPAFMKKKVTASLYSMTVCFKMPKAMSWCGSLPSW